MTYRCQSDCGTTLWRVYGYQMVDRDQYFDDGLQIQDEASGRDSRFLLSPSGREFLLSEYERHQLPSQERCRPPLVIDIQCFVLYDTVNAVYGNRYRAVVDGELTSFCTTFVHVGHVHCTCTCTCMYNVTRPCPDPVFSHKTGTWYTATRCSTQMK